MTPTRVAIAVCICCVGAMLLSACGLPLLPQPPTVETQRFVVTQEDGAGHTTLAAFGDVGGGDLEHLFGYLTVAYPDCPDPPAFHLTGGLNLRSQRIKLAGAFANGRRIAIDGVASVARNGATYVDLRFSGILIRPAGCNDAKPVQVAISPTPFVPLGGVFRGSATAPDGRPIELSMAIRDHFFDIHGRYASESTINIAGSPCFHAGTSQRGAANYMQNIAASLFNEVYRMDDGSTLTAVIARPAWFGGGILPLTLPTHFSVEGGACDKQTFDATLLPVP